ncbi:MAG: AzlD domain-containing protein [Syntrophales bacterium]|jgi:branched-subunit amino acid transport protein|nr:AzlD domain-containing protein [Syntrophales bacterium]
MMPANYLYILLGMGIVTYVPRWLPLVFLSRRRLPQWFEQWLDLIPAAILSALIFPILITTGEPRHLDLMRPELLVALPTFLFAVKTRSLAGSVVVGMFLFWLTGKFL